jgi:Domain of unknown function (DUF4440)
MSPLKIFAASMSRHSFALVLATALLTVASARSIGQGRWADANDPIAKQLIEQERKWAVLECEPSNVVAESLADDFVGTSPSGPRYTKAEALAEAPPAPGQARGCKLLTARVRFYGTNVAMIYGSETSVRKQKDGKEFDRTLIWTDTWLKRNGKWQIIAAQDMIAPKE